MSADHKAKPLTTFEERAPTHLSWLSLAGWTIYFSMADVVFFFLSSVSCTILCSTKVTDRSFIISYQGNDAKIKMAATSDNDNDIFVSAPGKVILHGEHAVVYGKNALATSLNLRTYLRLTSLEERVVKLHLPDIGLNQSWDVDALEEKFADLLGTDPKDCRPPSDEELARLESVDGYRVEDGTRGKALLGFVYLYLRIVGGKGQKLAGCHALVISQLPTGAGLGSSAAFSVCVAAALLQKVGAISANNHASDTKDSQNRLSKLDLDLVNLWAFEVERLIHGTPSGIDNSVSVFGGALRFCKKPEVTITPLDTMPQLRILLVNTKVPRSTMELVAGVRKKLDKHPSIIEPILDLIEKVALKGEAILQSMTSSDDGIADLEELIDMNQDFLSILGVSHPSLQQVCLLTSQHGLHSKLTGAGGGGCAFTLLRPDTPAHSVEAICGKLQECGYEAWETCLGGVGVVCHGSEVTGQGFCLPEQMK